ncbi:MAG: hypothetical protein U9Q27_03085 [Patescibacteria group bacterium]|nr:hypothetical protein [Patescibacteria group bacterium]
MKKIFLIIVLFSVLAPFQTASAGLVPCGCGADSAGCVCVSAYEDCACNHEGGVCTCTLCHFFILFERIIEFVLFEMVPIISVLMLVVGGIYFFGAGGNPSMMETGKKIISSVVIGLIIIFSSWIIINSFFSFIGVSEWTGLEQGWWNIKCSVDCMCQ